MKMFARTIRYIRSVIREKSKERSRSSHWKVVRDNFVKNNPACAACGSKTKLQVHHMQPFHLYPNLELSHDNLICLCMDVNECHLLIGHGDDYKCYNPNVKEDAARCLSTPGIRKSIIEEAKKNRLKDEKI